MNQENNNTSTESSTYYPKADLGKRILAYLIDCIIGGLPGAIVVPLVLIPFFTVTRSYDYYNGFARSGPNVVLIILIVMAVLLALGWGLFYFLFRDGFGKGQSWGKKICGLMVVNLDDNRPCNKSKSFVRNIFAWIIAAVASWVPVLNLLASFVEPIVAMVHEKGHRVGDMVARTQVINIEHYRSDNL